MGDRGLERRFERLKAILAVMFNAVESIGFLVLIFAVYYLGAKTGQWIN